MKHIIRVDIPVDEKPVDDTGVYPHSWQALQPLRDKYAALIGSLLELAIEPNSVRVFPMREGKVENGRFYCPNGHDTIYYFETVFSTRGVESELRDGVLLVHGDSKEHDGESDLLDYCCSACNVNFTLPAGLEMDFT